ncbi:MAG: serine hydrolase domain-containing protein [Lysobacter sp.]
MTKRPALAAPFVALLLAAPLAQASESVPHPPVATVRVVFDRDGVTATDVHGLADKASGRAVTAGDPVRIASISKLVTAIGVMRLVEAGTLDLDADVGDLLGWPLRNPAHPDTPITLRLLLSHRSSLTDAAGYWQTPLGGQLRDILDDPRAWDTAHAPGTYFRYTNLNFPLIAQVMERATGERFDRLMDRLVLQPLGIEGCFNWATCNDAAVARAVVIYDGDGAPNKDDLHGDRPDCPVIAAEDGSCDLSQWRPGDNGALFSPQGGLRISANGLARIGRMLLGEGELDGVRLLTPASVRELATPLWQYTPGQGLTFEEDTGDLGRGFFCRYGLAMQTLATAVDGCRDDPFGDGVARVGHSGSAYGLQSGLWLDRDGGTGVVWFATGMPGERLGGRSAFSAVEEALAHGE